METRVAENRPGFVVRRIGCVVLSVIAAALAGCSGGEVVTADSLATAKAAWARAEVRDYQLEWKVSGSNNAHYMVTVRGGEVALIVMQTPKGEWITAHPAESKAYSVDGLFTTIANEMAQLKSDRPFGQPPGAKVVMRARFDPALGYPHSYHRDVLGTVQGIAIDVIKLTPAAAPRAPGGESKA